MSVSSLPDGFNSTSSLEFSNAIEELNQQNVDSNEVKLFDPLSESYLSMVRSTFSNFYKAKYVPKDEYLGYVIKIEDEQDSQSQRFFKRIYVNVPLKDVEGIENQDEINEDFDASSIQHKIFYPVSEKVEREELPYPGAVVRVKLSKDYFNRSISNPRENKYLGMFGYNVFAAPKRPEEIANVKDRKASVTEGFQKKQLQDSLFLNKPETAIDEKYFVRIPYDGDYLVSSLPAIRKPPPNSRSQSRGIAVQGHYAIDVAMPEGIPIVACTDHEIVPTGFDGGGFGNFVKAKNDKYLYYYGHLKQKIALSGTVKEGTIIGYSGNTGGSSGPHLHFEIRDFKGNKINPLFFMKGSIKLKDSIKQEFNFNTDTISLPWPTSSTAQNVSVVIPFPEPKPETPVASPPEQTTSTQGSAASKPTSRPKLLLATIETDLANANLRSDKRGAKAVKIREDIYPDVLKIKNILNDFNSKFSCEYIDVKINNKKISDLARVGLEIHLNPHAGLTDSSNIEFDNYFIGPNYRDPVGNGYRLNVYAVSRSFVRVFNSEVSMINEVLDVYDVSQTYLKNKPKIIKIFKPVINLSSLFESFGFMQMQPDQKFFSNSDWKLSNWNKFYKPSKIVKGYSYKQLLETVYINNKDQIWNEKDKFWNGSKFI